MQLLRRLPLDVEETTEETTEEAGGVTDPILSLSDVTGGLEVWFPAPLERHQQQLMDALGVVVHVDPPERSAVSS